MSVKTRARVGERISLGTWTSTRPMRYIDLAEPVRLPSIFDLIFDHQRSMVRFLNQFGIEISKPLDDESTPAVDYLATQIVSEYFRWYLPTSTGPGVDAIRFRSALTEGGINWAIFVGPDECGPHGSGRALELQEVRHE